MKYICAMAVILSLMVCSCSDDFNYYNGEIPEGEGDLSATVTFTPASATSLGATRTPGNEIKDIKSLCVLVYTTGGELVRTYVHTSERNDFGDTWKSTDYDVKPTDHLDGTDAEPEAEVKPGDTEGTTKLTTPQVSFNIPNLPYGRYKIYAVANMGDMSGYSDVIQTEEGLRNIQVEWNSETIGANNQMFGYFAEDNKIPNGFNAPPLTFIPGKSNIHAWINRLASKLTVAFDASGLNQGVLIYIKNVTVRDIPKACFLGNTNKPSSMDDLLNTWTIKHDTKPDYTNPSKAIVTTRFEYNSGGIIGDPENPDKNPIGSEKTDGYKLENSLRQPVPAGAHDPDAASLFFFENNQGDFDNQSRYDKRQQKSGDDDGVGTPIRVEETGNDGKINDFKDKVKYGTYVEVEAYYISTNPGKVGEGSIKYRFMLGKNITYNYDAQRNYHFKLTLGFKGWANQPDWHIDYEQPQPGIEVQPVFRVSYLYNQKSELPVRILETAGATVERVDVKIVENNWAPYDPSNGLVPDSVTDPSPNKIYAFRWNKAAYESMPYMVGGIQVPYYGFLALHLPPKSTASEIIEKDYGLQSNIDLERYYIDNHEGDRSFDGAEELEMGDHGLPNDSDRYTVKPVLDELNKPVDYQKTLMVPVWTRAKSLIRDSGFSGNNPYEGYERKAKLEITATFSLADGTKWTTPPEEVDVFQVKRLVNPKGVWRAADRNAPFHVTLLEAESGNDMADFIPFESEGEWTAYIDVETNKGAGFYITPNEHTNGYQDKEGRIHGYTGSEIHFDINFDKVTVDATAPKCAIVKVLYHGNQCTHKILVRKGYDQPVTMGGQRWSSFSLYRATYTEGSVADGTDTYEAVLTKNPLMLGSMFRRGRQDKGIFVTNNMAEEGGVGVFEAPGAYRFIVGKENGNDWVRETWSEIGYRDDVTPGSTSVDYGRKPGSQEYGMGTFFVKDEDGIQKYKVPSYQNFHDLTEESDFGFGVVYGSAATKPATKALDAYGLIDPYNEGLFDDERGMRGVIAYSKKTGDQLFFPMGKYGTGRRNNFIMEGDNAGVLRYGDVNYLLTIGRGNNLYRPIPYNVMVQSGNIYWIDKYKANVREGTTPQSTGCLGWDMNYFNFDFNNYPANNYRDACPIKLILVD